MRNLILLATLWLTACAVSPNTEHVTILRDQYGTPQVFADDLYGAYYGYGYALAEDRLFQIEMLKRTAQGQVAEVLGSDYLTLDTMIRTTFDHRSVQSQMEKLSTRERDVLEGYAAGINAYVAAAMADPSAKLPGEFSHYDFQPSTWTAYDAAMQFVGSIVHRYSEFNSELDNLALLRALEAQHGRDKAWSIFSASKWLLDEESPTTVPAAERPFPATESTERPSYLAALSGIQARTRRVVLNTDGGFKGTTDMPGLRRYLARQIGTNGPESSPEFAPASNYWAVDSNRLLDADGALVNGPQFDWGMPSYVYGIGLHAPGFDVVGNTLLGLPNLLFAHNNYVSWGSTAGLSDQVDVFVETLHPNDDNRYLHLGEYREFERWEETIRVAGGPDVVVTARRSVHGMVQSLDAGARSAITRARAWEGGEVSSLMAWVFMPDAKNLRDARQMLKGVTTNINFYFMDSEGNLSYTHGGRYPQRHPDQDSRLPTPGTGEYDWLGFRPFWDNPTTENPEQGYIANWNNRPSADWISIDLWSYTWARADRARLLFDALEAQPVFAAEDIWAINRQISSADVTAPFLWPGVAQALQSGELSTTYTQAMALLDDWNGQWQLTSASSSQFGPAALLFESFLSDLLETVLADDIGPGFFHFYSATNNPNKPLGASMGTAPGSKVLIALMDDLAAGREPIYDFFNGIDHQMVITDQFTRTVDRLIEQHGDELGSWRLAAAPMTWKPYNFRGVPQALAEAAVSVPAYLNRGSENNYFIARDGVIVAYDVVPPGQSGFVSIDGKRSPHSTDQMPMFADFELKPLAFTRQQAEAQATSRQRLTIVRSGQQLP